MAFNPFAAVKAVSTASPITNPDTQNSSRHELSSHRFQQPPLTPQPQPNPTRIDHEQDTPLDEFDRQLLASTFRDDNHIPRYASQRLTIPPQSTARKSSNGALEEPQMTKQNDTRNLPLSTSLDPVPFSSPTDSMLEKKHLVRRPSEPRQLRNAFNQSLAAFQKRRGMVQYPEKESLLPHPPSDSTARAPCVRGIQLVPTTALLDKQRSIFKFPVFNAVQSKCFPTAYDSDDNLVVSAPTGSGKTVIMELGILRLIDELKSGKAKAVYQAPTKSLCSERFRDWQSKFAIFDLKCAELTGDAEYVGLKNVASASIIITTPEKWDSVTRKWKDNAKLMDMIRLFLVDEVHILRDIRGATLEVIVSRMKSVGNSVRFIALSATIPNSDDVAVWLTKNESARHLPAVREVFGDSFRPVQLKKHILGHEGPYNPWAFDSALTEKIPEVVVKYSKGKPVMIFCPTRESSQKTAVKLAESWLESPRGCKAWNGSRIAIKVENESLQKLLPAGVAFHHANLDATDRKAVEQGFLDGHISIICSTSTLAVGINLPCYLTILKGTQTYTNAGLQEYSSLDVMQMLGRAGRPQFETEAAAVIMCLNERMDKYKKMVAGEELLESSLHQNLIEHLNAEIGIGTINSMHSAQKWLASTFLNVRLQRNPKYYNLDPDQEHTSCDTALLKWCEKDLELLYQQDLINNDGSLRCTEYGDAMARYCAKFETMKVFMNMPPKAKVSDILSFLSQAVEFRDFRLKQGGKTFYKDLNKSNDIRYPVQVDIALTQHKISIIVQAKLGCVQMAKDNNKKGLGGQIRQLSMDTAGVISHSKRLIRLMVDILLQRNDAVGAKSALELARGLSAGVWDDTAMQLKQIPGIGDVFMRKLAAAGIKSIDALFNTEPHRIEVVLSKNPPFGHELVKKLTDFPMLHISAKESGKQMRRDKGVEVKVQCEVGFLNESVPFKWNSKQYNVLFLCETSYGHLIDFRRFQPGRLKTKETILLTALVDQPASKVRCHIMCDDIAGTHRFAEIEVGCPASWFPAQRGFPGVAFQRPKLVLDAHRETKTEDFVDEGLNDSDLLAVASDPKVSTKTEDGIEVVEDIDEIMADIEHNKNGKQSRKRSRTQSAGAEKASKEPQQLPNGNWKCQHTCEEEDKECKHPCCRDGVKNRPTRKKLKTEESDISRQTKQKKDSAKLVKQERPMDSMLHKANMSRKISSSGSLPSKKDRASSKTSRTQQMPHRDHLLEGETMRDSWGGTSRPHEEWNTQQAVSEAFDFGDYDWQAMDDIAAMYDEQQDDVQQESNLSSSESKEQLKGAFWTSSTTMQAPNFGCTNYTMSDDRFLYSRSSSPCKAMHEPQNNDVSIHGAYVSYQNFDMNLDGVNLSTSDSTEQTAPMRRTELLSRACLEPSTDPCNSLQDSGQYRGESEEERQRSRFEEDQKRRWADIGSDWLTYEAFGKYVRIMDDPEAANAAGG